MSAIIKTLKLKDEQILPKTAAKAVFTEDGYSVEDKLKNIGNGFSGSYNDLTDKPVADDIEYNSENSGIQANNIQEAIDQIMDLKGTNNGFAALDSTGKIPQSQIPSMDYIPISQKGVANGVATLDNEQKIPINQIPDLNYIPIIQKGAAEGVASLNINGIIPNNELYIEQILNPNITVELYDPWKNQSLADYEIIDYYKFGPILIVRIAISITSTTNSISSFDIRFHFNDEYQIISPFISSRYYNKSSNSSASIISGSIIYPNGSISVDTGAYANNMNEIYITVVNSPAFSLTSEEKYLKTKFNILALTLKK